MPEENIYSIYKITNLINCKSYIGQTKRFNERMKEHCSDIGSCISRAINKYGKDNFSFEIIESNLSFEEVQTQESYYIEYYDTFGPNGYNLTTGGEGYEISEEIRNKMGHSGENHWAFGLKGEDHPSYGRRNTEETISLQSELKLGILNPMFGKTGELCPNFGRKHTEEELLKIGRNGENHWAFGLKGEDHPNFGLKRTEEQNETQSKRQRNKFLVTHPNGYQEIVDNLKEFCKEYNLTYSGMINVSSGVSIDHKGFKCENLSKETILKQSELKPKNQFSMIEKKHSDATKNKISKSKMKTYLITFPDGHIEIINDLKQFCINYNLTHSCMRSVANGWKKQHKGFKCEHYI